MTTPSRARHRDERDQTAAEDQDMPKKTLTETLPDTPPTFADIAKKKLRKRLTEYRALVERAVEGEQLREEDLVNAFDCLTSMGIPPYAFDRDVAGVKDHARNLQRWTEWQEREPADRERGRQVAEEIATLTKRLNELKTEAHRLSVGVGMRAASCLQRVNELKALHPHVLLPIDEAVEVRAKALRLDAPLLEPAAAGAMS